MRRELMGIVAAGVVLSAQPVRADYYFEVQSGQPGGDISSDGPDGWNGVLGQNDAYFFRTPGPFTCSTDVSFYMLVFQTGQDTATFDLSGRTVTLTRNDQYALQNYSDGADVRFSGGTIDLGGNGTYVQSYQSSRQETRFSFSGTCLQNVGDVLVGYQGSCGNTMKLTDGASVRSTKNLIVGDYGGAENAMILDNSTLTDISNTWIGYCGGVSNRLVLTNGASIVNADHELVVNCENSVEDKQGHDNLLEVNGNCSVSVRNLLTDDYGNYSTEPAGPGNGVRISGEGAVVDVASLTCIGVKSASNVVTVADGGELKTYNLQMGHKDLSLASSLGNALRIQDGGTVNVGWNLEIGGGLSGDSTVFVENGKLDVKRELLLGTTASSHGNRLVATGSNAVVTAVNFRPGGESGSTGNSVLIADGATLEATQDAAVGQVAGDTSVTVSNATFKAPVNFWVGQHPTASGCSLRLLGPETVFETLVTSWSYSYFGQGGNGLLEIGAGCSLATARTKNRVGDVSNGNVFRVTGAGSLWNAPDEVLFVGRNDGNDGAEHYAQTQDNRIEVRDGAVYETGRLFVHGLHNGVVVSNGTLNVNFDNDYHTSAVLGDYDSGETYPSVNNDFVRFEGASPRMRFAHAGGGLSLWNGARLEFVVPAEPYAEPPLVGYWIDAHENAEIEIDLSALPKDHGRLKYVLARVYDASQTAKVPEAVLSRANELLAPSRATLAWKDTELVLSVPGTRGMAILIR